MTKQPIDCETAMRDTQDYARSAARNADSVIAALAEMKSEQSQISSKLKGIDATMMKIHETLAKRPEPIPPSLEVPKARVAVLPMPFVRLALVCFISGAFGAYIASW